METSSDQDTNNKKTLERAIIEGLMKVTNLKKGSSRKSKIEIKISVAQRTSQYIKQYNLTLEEVYRISSETNREINSYHNLEIFANEISDVIEKTADRIISSSH